MTIPDYMNRSHGEIEQIRNQGPQSVQGCGLGTHSGNFGQTKPELEHILDPKSHTHHHPQQ